MLLLVVEEEETKQHCINEMIEFPSLGVKAAVETWLKDEEKLLNCKTPELNLLCNT